MIIIPASFDSFRSLKDNTLKVTFETNELNPQQLLGLAENLNKFGHLAFNRVPFTEVERKLIEGLEPELQENGKTESQRLRGVLFRNFERNNDGFDSFVKYYAHHMEKIINHFKSKLD